MILAKELKREIHPEGRPVESGFISSYFGEREDPFDGQETFHKGVDFAGAKGSTVVAVAAGVVTWAGERSGFGKLVEINHGDGYVTRYAHNEKTLVSVGRDGQARRSGRTDGLHRSLYRPARALRGAAQRPPGRPAVLHRPLEPARRLRPLNSRAREPIGRERTSIAYNTPLSTPVDLSKCLRLQAVFPHTSLPLRQLLTRVFGSRNERIVRGWGRYVRAANQLEPARSSPSPMRRCGPRPRSSATRLKDGRDAR